MERGCLPCDEKGNLLGAEEVEAKVDANDMKTRQAPDDDAERVDAIKAAIDMIVERNDSKDFAGPTPSAAAVSGLTGWQVTQKEVRAIWEKVREGKQT